MAFAGLALSVVGVVRAQVCTSTVETVGRQVGESVVFCGTPTEVHFSSKPGGPINLNFGGKYPDQAFTVVIFADVAGDRPQDLLDRYAGKTVRVSGVVKNYNGRPEIVLRKLAEIAVE